MTTGLASRRTVSPRPTAGSAITRLAVRHIRRGTLTVAAVCTAMSATVAVQYRSTFQGELNQGALSALAENPAIRILFGPPVALDDPGGFTVWRTGTPVLILAGVWIMLAAIRITRGEEDAGRWDLLLAGPVRPVDALRCCVSALAGAALVISTGVAIGMVAAGTDTRGAVVYAFGVLGVTLAFAAVGLAAGQVMPSRSSAVGLATGFLGIALLIRMLADGVSALAWAAWLSPLGLIARVAPYAENRVVPLVVLACYSTAFAAAAVTIARSRDVGSGLVLVSTRRSPHTRFLDSVSGFAVRRSLRSTAGWAAGVGSYFLIVGAMITSILDFFDQNPRFAELAAGAGFSGLDSAAGFAAALFSLLAIPTGLYAATRLGAFVGAEAAGHWTMVFATPVPRRRLLGAEIAVTAGGVVVLHIAAAAGIWGGAAVTGAPLGLAEALAGVLNTAPIAGLALSASALAVGWVPSLVGAIGAVPVVGGFLVQVIADSMRAPAWVRDISPFAHVSAVPSTPPDGTATAALLLIGAVLIVLGVAGYGRRDLTS
ncbi:MAG: ABC transporter permease [Mycobacterium sp.]